MAISESDGVWAQPVEIPGGYLTAVSCPAAGACVATGLGAAGGAYVVEQSAGVWHQQAVIEGITPRKLACSAPGWCVVLDPENPPQKVVNEVAGVWGKPEPLPLPADAAPEYQAELNLACQPAEGRCVVAGRYESRALGHMRMMGVSEVGGKWGTAQVIAPAPDGNGAEGTLLSVACPASGSCFAVGDDKGPIGTSETNGVWAPVSGIAAAPGLAAGKTNYLEAIGCPSEGLCFGVGFDEPGPKGVFAPFHPTAVAAIDGTWGQTVELGVPPSEENEQLRHIACGAVESCLAIGPSIAASEVGGVWGAGLEITAPPGAGNARTAQLALIACPGQGPCAALGTYNDQSGSRLMAAGMTPSSPRRAAPRPPHAVASLAARRVTVLRSHRALVRLSCKGRARCAGTVKLIVRTPNRNRRRATATVIGKAGFAIPSQAQATVKVGLNSAGRARLRAAHGHMSAVLLVSQTTPPPARKELQGVRLSQAR